MSMPIGKDDLVVVVCGNEVVFKLTIAMVSFFWGGLGFERVLEFKFLPLAHVTVTVYCRMCGR